MAEFVLAMALASVALLSLVAISLSALKSNRKATDTAVGALLAEQQVEQLVYAMQADSTAAIWAHVPPAEYSVDTINVSNTDFTVVVYARDPDPTFTDPHRLKRLEVVVKWCDSQAGNRAGMGKLEARAARLVRQI